MSYAAPEIVGRTAARGTKLVSHRCVGTVLLVLVACAYAAAYFNHPLFPGHEAAAMRGWWTWTDQNRYLQESLALAHGTLSPATYHYPVGYSALAAPFLRWMPVNPFFVPDLLLVLAASWVWWRLGQRWLGRVQTMLVGVLFVCTHRWLIGITQVVPWNTIATQAALLAGVWTAISVSGRRAVWWLAGLAAFTYVVRPIDAVTFAPLLVFAVWTMPSWRERVSAAVLGLAIIAVPFVAVAGLNRAVFGSWQSPYEAISMHTIGFFSYPIGLKFFWLFIDGSPLFGETEPALLFRYPWLFLVPPAVVYLVRAERARGAAVVAAVALNLVLYVNYNDLLPSDLYRFTLIHYLAWWFPLLFLLAAAACRNGSKDRWTQLAFAMSAALFITAIGLRLEFRAEPAVRLSDGSYLLPEYRPLLVHFPEAPLESVADVRLDGRPVREYSDYLVPYVASDLKMLIGSRTSGQRLTTRAGQLPEFGRCVGTWRLAPGRLRSIGQ